MRFQSFVWIPGVDAVHCKDLCQDTDQALFAPIRDTFLVSLDTFLETQCVFMEGQPCLPFKEHLDLQHIFVANLWRFLAGAYSIPFPHALIIGVGVLRDIPALQFYVIDQIFRQACRLFSRAAADQEGKGMHWVPCIAEIAEVVYCALPNVDGLLVARQEGVVHANQNEPAMLLKMTCP